MKGPSSFWLGSSLLHAALASASCVADLSNAVVDGHSASQETAVCEWLGIPYAQAPVGQLRFATPEAATALSGTFNASTWGYDCPQTQSSYYSYPNHTAQYAEVYANFVNQLNHTQSEDCLKLNIWNKPDSTTSKPVIVFIHGGRYTSGTSHTPFYDGEFLASAQDVVVVTFNFRMNIFGFPGAPDGTQNLGLLDQYTAVSWVSENIAAFGGDPSRITIIGQSSGSQAVGNWAYAFEDEPLVAGIVSHSGNVFSFPMNDADLAADNWYNVTGTLGCGTSGDLLDCMRSDDITIADILAAVKLVPTPPGSSVTRSQPTFQITIDNQTAWTVDEYVSRLQSGDLAKVPYFEIHNDHESGFYRISALQQGHALPESNWTLFEQETFTCPYAKEAYARAQLGIASYRARYMADWDNLRLWEVSATNTSGAYHGCEINMIIGNSEGVSGIAPVDDEVTLTAEMQKAWAAFAADPTDGLCSLGYPKYQANQSTLIRFGVNTSSTIDFVSPSMYDSICPSLGLDFWDNSIPV